MINSQLLAQVVLQITLSSIFICLFFFTYGKTQEEKSMEKQIEFLIDDLVGETGEMLTPEQREQIRKSISNINPDLSAEDEQVKQQNAKVWKKTVKFMIVMMIVGGFVVYRLWKESTGQGMWKSFSIRQTAIEALLALCVVALTEYVFLTYLGSEYITISPNKIKAQILTNISDYVYT